MDLIFLSIVGVVAAGLIVRYLTREAKEGKCAGCCGCDKADNCGTK